MSLFDYTYLFFSYQLEYFYNEKLSIINCLFPVRYNLYSKERKKGLIHSLLFTSFQIMKWFLTLGVFLQYYYKRVNLKIFDILYCFVIIFLIYSYIVSTMAKNCFFILNSETLGHYPSSHNQHSCFLVWKLIFFFSSSSLRYN